MNDEQRAAWIAAWVGAEAALRSHYNATRLPDVDDEEQSELWLLRGEVMAQAERITGLERQANEESDTEAAICDLQETVRRLEGQMATVRAELANLKHTLS